MIYNNEKTCSICSRKIGMFEGYLDTNTAGDFRYSHQQCGFAYSRVIPTIHYAIKNIGFWKSIFSKCRYQIVVYKKYSFETLEGSKHLDVVKLERVIVDKSQKLYFSTKDLAQKTLDNLIKDQENKE